jgi:hypothetical protein
MPVLESSIPSVFQMEGLLFVYNHTQGRIAHNLRVTLQNLVSPSKPRPSKSRGAGRGPKMEPSLSTQNVYAADRKLRSSVRTTGGISPYDLKGEIKVDTDSEDEKPVRRGRKSEIRRKCLGGEPRKNAVPKRKRRRTSDEDSEYEPGHSSDSGGQAESAESEGSDGAQGARGRMQATRIRVPGESGFSGARGELPQHAADALMRWFVKRWLASKDVTAP